MASPRHKRLDHRSGDLRISIKVSEYNKAMEESYNRGFQKAFELVKQYATQEKKIFRKGYIQEEILDFIKKNPGLRNYEIANLMTHINRDTIFASITSLKNKKKIYKEHNRCYVSPFFTNSYD